MRLAKNRHTNTETRQGNTISHSGSPSIDAGRLIQVLQPARMGGRCQLRAFLVLCPCPDTSIEEFQVEMPEDFGELNRQDNPEGGTEFHTARSTQGRACAEGFR